jgi:hypothetical protein
MSYITLRKNVTGWDKAIYYFSINNFENNTAYTRYIPKPK